VQCTHIHSAAAASFPTSLLLPLLLLLPAATAIKVYLNDGDKEPDYVIKVRPKHILCD
jgi:hypothetical protein